ncbi:MAG: YHS domain-containing protein [Chloroflexi bacterium]|nr:YHS domain-containing protein [Chloroflexota bacterium]
MDVDPATARWKAEYGGHTYSFCAPSCRRQFLADPEAFVGAIAGGT